MAVVWQASGAITGNIGTADVTPTLPAHAADDILILVTTNRDVTNTCATPSGWTLLFGPVDETAWRSYVFWKRAASGAETNPLCNWTATSADKYAQVHNVRGAIATGDPFAAAAWTDGAADPAVCTGVTTTAANQYVCTLGMCADNLTLTASTVTATDPASWTNRNHVTNSTGADATGFFFDAVRATAGATGNVSHDFTAVPLHWGVLVAAITAAPVAVGPSDLGTSWRVYAPVGATDLVTSWKVAVSGGGTVQSVFTFTPGTWSSNFDTNLITGNDFSSAVAGQITGVYIWSPSGGPTSVTVAVHRQSDQALMTSQVASMAQDDDWNLVVLSSPVTYSTPGEKFTISYINPGGFFVYKQSITDTTTGDLTAYVTSPSPGRWLSGGTAGQYPTNTDPGTGYAVGMEFTTSGGGTTPVGATDLATSWRVAARVTADLVTSWRVYASVGASDLATSWRVQARVTSDLATSWRVYAPVGATDLVTSWRVYAPVGATDLTTSWRVLSSLTPVTSDLVTSWRVAARVTSDLATSWRVYAPVVSNLATSWRVYAPVGSADLVTSWRVLQAVLPVGPSDLATSWKVYAAVAPADLITSWRVLILPIVIRPNTGTITRPSTGTITRPSTGTVARPSTGTIVRPDTGVVSRP